MKDNIERYKQYKKKRKERLKIKRREKGRIGEVKDEKE